MITGSNKKATNMISEVALGKPDGFKPKANPTPAESSNRSHSITLTKYVWGSWSESKP